jgi:hypothetical protein
VWLDRFADASLALGWVERVAAVALLLACAELLARPATLAYDGLLSWQVARLRSPNLVTGRRAVVLDAVLAPPGVHALVAARAGGAVVLLAAPSGSTAAALGLLLATGATVLLMLRTSYGNDGADQMLMLVLVAATIARLAGSTEATRYALWFIALQCILSYATSGVAKLCGRPWRDGTGLTGILGTDTYGVRRLAALLERHRSVAIALSWAIILTESLFVAVLFVPDRWVLPMLIGALAFHLATAAVMGLNAFVLAFGATYPAIAFAAI